MSLLCIMLLILLYVAIASLGTRYAIRFCAVDIDIIIISDIMRHSAQ